MTSKINEIDYISAIKNATNERKLLAIAYAIDGDIMSGQMTSEYYAECCVLLSKRLGFGVTPANLKVASDKYLKA